MTSECKYKLELEKYKLTPMTLCEGEICARCGECNTHCGCWADEYWIVETEGDKD
jgi:hypothetical protein